VESIREGDGRKSRVYREESKEKRKFCNWWLWNFFLCRLSKIVTSRESNRLRSFGFESFPREIFI